MNFEQCACQWNQRSEVNFEVELSEQNFETTPKSFPVETFLNAVLGEKVLEMPRLTAKLSRAWRVFSNNFYRFSKTQQLRNTSSLPRCRKLMRTLLINGSKYLLASYLGAKLLINHQLQQVALRPRLRSDKGFCFFAVFKNKKLYQNVRKNAANGPKISNSSYAKLTR